MYIYIYVYIYLYVYIYTYIYIYIHIYTYIYDKNIIICGKRMEQVFLKFKKHGKPVRKK